MTNQVKYTIQPCNHINEDEEYLHIGDAECVRTDDEQIDFILCDKCLMKHIAVFHSILHLDNKFENLSIKDRKYLTSRQKEDKT